jgi:hypothetical protein
MRQLIVLVMLFSSSLWANLHLAPPSFNVPGGRAVFADFKTARYHITYDANKRRADVVSSIDFEIKEAGYPIFDLVPDVEDLTINGQRADVLTSSFPGGLSKIRMAKVFLQPGSYTMALKNRLKKNLSFGLTGKVKSALWIRDLKDRMFMEQYFPSNLEFDQYRIIMNIDVVSRKKVTYEIYTNGEISQLAENSWRIIFPEYFTVASPYMHITPKGRMKRIDYVYRSISGRNIPITVYSKFKRRTKRFEAESRRVMAELEADYGPFGHPKMIAYGAGRGGMEHAGATMTSFLALDHEMLHFYFAKGVFPANGNSGWIDEAIASWRDKGYQRNPSMSYTYGGLASHSVYRRHTDSNAYSLGAEFMAYLDYRLQNTGGLKAFLRGYFAAYRFTMITTEHFKNNLEFFSGLELDELFRDTVYTRVEEGLHKENPNHPVLSEKELNDLL